MSEDRPHWIARGSAAYRRMNAAFFFAGFAIFSLLYCVQPLLPILAQDFAVSPAASSLSLSLSTALLALAILAAAALSERLGRRGLMFASIATAAFLNIAAAGAPSWALLLAIRALEGIALGGAPAVAMTYLAEEIHPSGLGFAMGLYVAGTAFGGMSGRVITGVLAEAFSWRVAMAGLGAAGLASAIGFILLIPPSRNFRRQTRFDLPYHLRAWSRHLGDPALRLLFAIGFLVMGAFVCLYNYAGFRLTEPPFDLDQSQLGLIFTIYLFGMAASWKAGALADRIGHRIVLPIGVLITAAGVGVTLLPGLASMIFGIILDHHRLLQRACGGERLGRPAGRHGQRPRLVPLSVGLLHRVEHHRLGRRLVLGGRALAGGRGLYFGGAGARARCSAAAEHHDRDDAVLSAARHVLFEPGSTWLRPSRLADH